uniref:Uncharacterized protein n=1 Tax=Cacopsylla melanoneura TaxID=428564 RepID=A0A8D8WGL2_9HEMI
MFSLICSFSHEANEALRASVIFLLVPGVRGGTWVGISSEFSVSERSLIDGTFCMEQASSILTSCLTRRGRGRARSRSGADPSTENVKVLFFFDFAVDVGPNFVVSTSILLRVVTVIFGSSVEVSILFTLWSAG